MDVKLGRSINMDRFYDESNSGHFKRRFEDDDDCSQDEIEEAVEREKEHKRKEDE